MESDEKNVYKVSPREKIGDFTFYLVPLRRLSAHEEVIHDLKNDLMMRMRMDNVLRDPIIADYKRGLIIDGTHRAAVLREMNMDYVVIQHIDYMDPNLRLYRWFRLYKGVKSIPTEIDEMVVKKDIFSMSGLDRYPLYIVYKGVLSILSNDIDMENIMDGMRVVEDIFEKYGYERGFISEDEVVMRSEVLENSLLLGYRYITKKEVLELHEKGYILNHKSTRHVPPYRAIGIDIPIDYLSTDNIEKAVKYLENIKLEYIGEKVVVDGRYYAEKVFKRRG